MKQALHLQMHQQMHQMHHMRFADSAEETMVSALEQHLRDTLSQLVRVSRQRCNLTNVPMKKLYDPRAIIRAIEYQLMRNLNSSMRASAEIDTDRLFEAPAKRTLCLKDLQFVLDNSYIYHKSLMNYKVQAMEPGMSRERIRLLMK